MRENKSLVGLEQAFIDLNDVGYYEFTCSKGHLSFNAVQEQKFELLFQNGCHAILDGYCREAITSFSASLESFYAFFIEISCIKNETPKEDKENSWKIVTRQSERQLGAFLYLWLTEYKKIPKLLKQRDIEFRNTVVHQGKIPTSEEAINFGQSVLYLFEEYLPLIKTSFIEEIRKATHEHIKKVNSQIPEGSTKSGSTQPTIISLIASEESKSLEKHLIEVSNWRRKFNSSKP